MIVENSEKPLRSVKKLLSAINYEIAFETSNGYEAVEKYELVKPDLLIMDLKPSKNDGLSIVKEIKKSHPESRIIIVTLQQDSSLMEECLKSGANCCMTIPFNMKEFVSTVTSMGSAPQEKSTVAPMVFEES